MAYPDWVEPRATLDWGQSQLSPGSAKGINNSRILTKRGNIGMRVFGGRMETAFSDGGTAKTHHCVRTTALHFDSVRVILSAANPGVVVPVTKLAVSLLANTADLNGSAGTWFPGLFSGSAAGSIPARVMANRRTYLVSDLISLSSIARNDGGSYPLIAIRAHLGTPGTYTMLGNNTGTDSFTNWLTKPDGRIHVMRYNDGDCVTTPASFTDTTNRNTSPIIGVIYYARGEVVNVVGFGDSIIAGRGTYKGEGWGMPACAALTAEGGRTYEWSNLAWDGTSMNDNTNGDHEHQLDDAIAAGLPIDIANFFCMGTNDFSGDAATFTDPAVLTEAAQPLSRMLASCRNAGIAPIIAPCLPVSFAIAGKNWDSADARRTAWNASVKARPDVSFMDVEPVFSGPIDGDGQVTIIASQFADGIHPSDAGNAAAAVVLANEIRTHI